MKVINFHESATNLKDILASNKDCIFFHIEHEKKFINNDNIIKLSRRSKKTYNQVIELANNGYYLYMTKDEVISSFVRHDNLKNLWNPIKNGEFLFQDGLVYSLTPPTLYENVNLLVVFSSVAGDMYNSSLFRYFEQNFKSVQKHISPNTLVLRIADVGGIVGSYYLNNKYLKNNEKNIQKLITDVGRLFNVNKTVLFGVSKGGCGAFYHGIKEGYDFLAVDPILNDDLYLEKHNDLHFVKDTFEHSKKDKIKQMMENFTYVGNACIITALKSPQMVYIKNQLGCNKDKFSIFVNNNPYIKDHPDVAPNSIHLISTILNTLLNGFLIDKKTYNFY